MDRQKNKQLEVIPEQLTEPGAEDMGNIFVRAFRIRRPKAGTGFELPGHAKTRGWNWNMP